MKIQVSSKHTAQKDRCGLPDSIVMVPPATKKAAKTWMSFGKCFIPMAVVDGKSSKLASLPGSEHMTREVRWTSVDGKQALSSEMSTKAEKNNGIFWFKEIMVHVAGRIEIEFSLSKTTCKSVVLGFDVDMVEADFDEAPSGPPPRLPRGSALHRPMGGNTKILGNGLALSFDDVLSKVFFDNYAVVVGLAGAKDLPWEVPRPNATTLLNMASHVLQDGKSSASLDDVDRLKSAFEVVFESKLLYPEERKAYGKALEKAHMVDCIPFADCAGAAHLLRMLVLMGLRGSMDEFELPGASSNKRRKTDGVLSSTEAAASPKERMQEVANAIMTVIRKVTDEN